MTSSRPWCGFARWLAIAASPSRSLYPSPSRSSPGPRAVAAAKGPPLRAVLWDLDGTLTDSVRLVVETMNAVIAAHGGPLLPYEKVGELTGLPLDAMFRLAWPDLGAADLESYRVEYWARHGRGAVPPARLCTGPPRAVRRFD